MDSSGQDKFCRCPNAAVLHAEPPCKQWRDHPFFWDDKASDYIFGFVNKVARGVAQTHPGKYLSIAAYHQTYYPPTREPLERNVAVTFTIHAALRPVPAMDRAVKGLLDKWDEESKQRPKYLWLYFHRPGPADPLFPGFMAHHLVRQMEDYHRRGFKGIFAEPAYFPRQGRQEGDPGRAPIVTLLELYLAYKLADDPALDGNKLIDEFFPLFYGAAAEPMRRLYDAIERAYCDPATYATSPATYYGYQTPAIAWKRIGTRERMLELKADERGEGYGGDRPGKDARGAVRDQRLNRMKKASMETVWDVRTDGLKRTRWPAAPCECRIRAARLVRSAPAAVEARGVIEDKQTAAMVFVTVHPIASVHLNPGPRIAANLLVADRLRERLPCKTPMLGRVLLLTPACESIQRTRSATVTLFRVWKMLPRLVLSHKGG